MSTVGDRRRPCTIVLTRSRIDFLTADATLAIEVSQVREDGRTRPLVWQLGTVLSQFLLLQEDLVRINTAPAEARPGYDHSHVLVFRPLR